MDYNHLVCLNEWKLTNGRINSIILILQVIMQYCFHFRTYKEYTAELLVTADISVQNIYSISSGRESFLTFISSVCLPWWSLLPFKSRRTFQSLPIHCVGSQLRISININFTGSL